MINISLDSKPRRIWFAENTRTGKTDIRFSRREVREIRDQAKANGVNVRIGSYSQPTEASHG